MRLVSLFLLFVALLGAQGGYTGFFTRVLEEVEELTGCAAMVQAAMLACYQFDEGSGDVLTDYSGNANHGQLGSTSGGDTNDPAWSTDGGEIVLSFDGVDNQVDLPYGVFGGAFTISVAFELASAVDGTIIGPITGIEGLRWRPGSLYGVRIISAFVETVTAPGVGVWEVATLRRDASNKIDLFRNNGSAIRLFSDAAQSGNTGFNRLGRRATTIPWNGLQGFVAIYSTALTDSEITTTNYAAIKALKPGLGLP